MTYAETLQIHESDIALSDYSGTGNHVGYGHCGGTPPSVWEWTNNVAGATNALHFNGANSILTATNSASALNFTNNLFTINLWLNPLGYDPTGSNSYIMANGFDLTNGWKLSTGSAKISFSAETNGEYTLYTPNDSLAGWTMVTIVRDTVGTALIYFNGKQVATSGTFTSPASTSSNLVFGTSFLYPATTGAPWYDGNMWLPQIWSSALSPTDIANLYFKQVKGIQWP